MIITEKKPFSQILQMLDGMKKVFIMGCADCATLCSTGGETETEDMRLKLEKAGFEVTGVLVPGTPCHIQRIRRELSISRAEVAEANAVLILACGAGVQSVAEILKNKPVLPALNSLFLGNVVRHGFFDERCCMCGECILDKTMGVCPVTRCAKGLTNGPCGGSKDGKCEVIGHRDCAWAEIFRRFADAGRTDYLLKYMPMKDFEISIKPGSLDIRNETQDQRADRLEHFKDQKERIRRKFEKTLKDKGAEPGPPSRENRRESASGLMEALNRGKFVHTLEIVPPKGTNVESALATARKLKHLIDAFSINENPGSVMRMGSLSMSALFVREGMEPILHLTTRERNRLALQSELLGAYALGIRNILAMTGDHQSVGDHKEAKPVYDLDSVQLLRLARELSIGRDYNGNPLDGAPEFYLGGVVNPKSDMSEMQLIKMRKKAESGAMFFITQAIFDIEDLKVFMDKVQKAGIEARIIAGIIPLKSRKMALYMNGNIPGISVPDRLIERIDETGDKKSVSAEIARELVEGCRGLAHGVHVMPIGWYDVAETLLS